MVTERVASDAELLDVLDRGESMSPLERALVLAGAADPGLDAGVLPLGARDRLILLLRAQLFGEAVEARDTCPHCGQEASLHVGCAELERAGAATATTVVEVPVGEYAVLARPPTTLDLLAAERAPDPRSARNALLACTILSATRAGEPLAPAALPDGVIMEVGRRVADADPLAEILLDVTCDACAGSWVTVLEPADFVWRELQDWGRRLLWDVHVLATAYGWREPEILALPPGRRQAYLGLVLGA